MKHHIIFTVQKHNYEPTETTPPPQSYPAINIADQKHNYEENETTPPPQSYPAVIFILAVKSS